MKKKMMILLMALGSLLYAGPTLTDEVKVLLKDAKTNVSGITAVEASKLTDNKNVVFLDVRDPNEWKKGSITAINSVAISRGFLEIKYPKLILSKYKKSDEFIVYCALEPRSVFAANRLKDLGFTNVKYLKKGFKNWSKSGYKTTK